MERNEHVINPLSPSDAYMHQYTRSLLIPIMTCCLLAAAPLSEPMLGWGLLSQFPLFRYFPNFSTSPKYMLAIEHHVHIWQVLSQLSCGDTCQIWMWFKECSRYLCKIQNFANGEMNEQRFGNPHPRFVVKWILGNKCQWTWWRHQMETFSTLLALCEGNLLVTDGFLSQKPVMHSFDVFFDLHLNKQLSKQLRCQQFEMPSHSLWHHLLIWNKNYFDTRKLISKCCV